MRRVVARTAVVLALALVAACSGAPQAPAPLTQEQAERLAVVRFRNNEAGVREVAASVTGPDGVLEAELTGWVDFTRQVGYAHVGGTEGTGGLVTWSTTTLAHRDGAVTAGLPPLPPPEDGWASAALDPAASPVSLVLGLFLSLTADRPENPQLLAQSSAAWLGDEVVDGEDVELFRGPGNAAAPDVLADERLRYAVASDGTLVRLDAELGGGRSARLDLGPASPTSLDFLVAGP